MRKFRFSVVALLAGMSLAAAFGNEKNLLQLVKESKDNLIISEPVVMTEDITLARECIVTFRERGKIVAKGDVKLRINGPMSAGRNHIFDGFKPGAVKFAAGFQEQVFPQWWGAVPNDGKDDSDALQCAIDSNVMRVFVPQGLYQLDKAINMTDLPFGIILEGNGMSENGTVFAGNTGDVVFDTSGTRYLDFRNFRITSGKEKPSTIGILYARTDKVKFVEFNKLSDVAVKLDSDLKANNGNGTVAVYNYASELWRAYNVYLLADNAVVMTGYNIFGVKSPFHKIGNYSSMSCCSITGSSTLSGIGGPCVTLDNTFRIDIRNTYFTGGVVEGVELSQFAIATRGRGVFQQDIRVTGHLEQKRAWWFNDRNITGMELNGSSAPSFPAAIVNKGSISSSKIDLKTWIDIPNKESVLIKSEGGSIRNSEIILGACHSIDAPAMQFTGNTVRTTIGTAEALSRISVDSKNSSFMLMAKDGIKIINPGDAAPVAAKKPSMSDSPTPNLVAKPASGDAAETGITGLAENAKIGKLKVGAMRAAPFWRFTDIPEELNGLPYIHLPRFKNSELENAKYSFVLEKPATVYLFVFDQYASPEGWEATGLKAAWLNYKTKLEDAVFKKDFAAGKCEIAVPGFTGKPSLFIYPHAAVVKFKN